MGTPVAEEKETPSSSPSHEFSFTVSLNSSTSTVSSAANSTDNATKQSPIAIDLSPADEIFFHGHLLPLHFLSHLQSSTSARSSTNSLESFSLPISDDTFHNIEIQPFTPEERINQTNDDEFNINNPGSKQTNMKSKHHFMLFGLSKWLKEKDIHHQQHSQQQRMRKLKLEVSQFLKRYIKLVKPLLSTKGRRDNGVHIGRQSYSFSGTGTPRTERELMRGRRGEFSAPASMRTSPTNSGLLLATAGVPSPSSDSTMEELQAAIQAAIAHCKSSSISSDAKATPKFSVPVN